MPNYCCVPNCKTRSQKGSGVTFHKFPFRNKELLDQWITAINRENWTPSKSAVICSKHFYEMDFYPCQQRKQLRDTSVPSIFTCREDAEPYSLLEILNASDVSSEAADSSNDSLSFEITKVEVLMCPFENCGKYFVNKLEYDRHIKRVHSSEQNSNNQAAPNTMVCDLCEAEFKNRFTFIKHWKRFHKTCKIRIRNAKTFECDLCKNTYTSKVNLSQHIRRMHMGIKLVEYVCPHCGKTFDVKRNLNRHFAEHEEDKSEQMSRILSKLPSDYVYHMENCEFLSDNHFKVNLQFQVNSVEEGLHWVKQFEDQNSVILRKGQMRPSNKTDIFKVKYRCHQNTRPASREVKSRKNTNCPALLFLYVRPSSFNEDNPEMENSKRMKASVKLVHTHNHVFDSELLRYRRPPASVVEKFVKYFESGFSPSSALKTHIQQIKLEHEKKMYEVLADRSVCPDKQWVLYLYHKFKKTRVTDTNVSYL